MTRRQYTYPFISTKDSQTGLLKILDESHYYPWLKHQGYGTYGLEESHLDVIIAPIAKNPYQYKFGVKEWQDELGLNIYDFEARGYDPATVRTTTQDPLAEKFYSQSSYSFLNNNPMIYVDPTGMAADHVYELNNKTGEMKKIEHNNDTTDRTCFRSIC